MCGRVEMKLLRFLTSALDGGEWSAPRPGCLTAGERAPVTHLIGGLGGPQNRYGGGGEEKKSHPLPGIEPRSSIP
jgi:hypothetical protein